MEDGFDWQSRERDRPTISRPNLKEDAAEFIRGEILSGALRPGEKIDQGATASRLGFSKLPVREALITLESEALVTTVARHGAFVANLTPIDIEDHYEIYGRLSGLAAERAATTLTATELDELGQLVEAMRETPTVGDQERLNFRFHRLVNRGGSSLRLKSVLSTLARSIPYHFFDFSRDWARVANEDHAEIHRALADRDVDAAGAAMTAHLRRSGAVAVEYLRSVGFWDPQGADRMARVGVTMDLEALGAELRETVAD